VAGPLLGVADLEGGDQTFAPGEPARDQVHGQFVGSRDDPDPVTQAQAPNLFFQQALFLEVQAARRRVVLPQDQGLDRPFRDSLDQGLHDLQVSAAHTQVFFDQGRGHRGRRNRRGAGRPVRQGRLIGSLSLRGPQVQARDDGQGHDGDSRQPAGVQGPQAG